MDNHGLPDPFEFPADDDSGWTALKKAVAGIALGTLGFAAIIFAWSLT